MTNNLSQQAARALSAYTFLDTNDPLYEAYSDYLYARATRRGVLAAAARLKRALWLDAAVAGVVGSVA